jgi:hypothetical protein
MASGIGTLPWPVPGSDVTLEAYDDHDWGWLALTVTKTSIAGNYIAVDKSGASRIADTFAIPIAGAPVPPVPVPPAPAPAPPAPPAPPPAPVPATNAQLLDQALAELKQTTVSYSYWGMNPPPPGSHWAKALDLLEKLRQNI